MPPISDSSRVKRYRAISPSPLGIGDDPDAIIVDKAPNTLSSPERAVGGRYRESDEKNVNNVNNEEISNHVVDVPSPLSPFESLPNELFQDIVVRVGSDADLSSVIKTSPKIYRTLHPESQSCVWKQRFLAQYDYPFLESVLEFPLAYQGRQFILRNFDGDAFAKAQKHKSGHQLDVVKDIIMESYNKRSVISSTPTKSKNLSLLSSSDIPLWLIQLMRCGLYGSQSKKYGQPNFLFDMVQVSLSHLALSHSIPICKQTPTSRGNYDLATVYNYNLPSSTLAELFRTASGGGLQAPGSGTASSSGPTLAKPSEFDIKLNMHSLLHIRNFWQRHFADEGRGMGENTYAVMARDLAASNIMPREWDQPLQALIPIATSWYGHYSCIHPWPKNRQDLEERQSCAEDWNPIDPMTLQIESSTTNEDETFWPAVFSSIPAFSDILLYSSYAKTHNVAYIRGIAPFKRLGQMTPTTDNAQSGTSKWHPYLSARVNGFIHDIPKSALWDLDAMGRRFNAYRDRLDIPIPGWRHIVMVVWKPTSHYLLNVLSHAQEDYGGASAAQVSANLNTASIWAPTGAAGGSNPVTAVATNATQPQVSSTISNGASDGATTNHDTTAVPSLAEVEATLKKALAESIETYTIEYSALLTAQAEKSKANKDPGGSGSRRELPPLFSARHIRDLDDSYSPIRYLDWDDGTIEYAYAYEGIIIPGGKIMMGRWWRVHGIEGLGPGWEIDPDGNGVEVLPVPPKTPPATNEDADVDTDMENEDSDSDFGTSNGKGKGKGKAKAKSKSKDKSKTKKTTAKNKGKPNKNQTKVPPKPRRSTRQSKKRKAPEFDSDASDSEGFVDEVEEVPEEPKVEYEIVTTVNGVESRAVNRLERGPFLFWAA